MAQQIPNIPVESLAFLKSIEANNNRDWFHAHKPEYLEQQKIIEEFADVLRIQLNIDDVIETASGKKSMHRIYRDTRFSKDKTPYKNHWSGNFKRATSARRGGYYFHIEPGNSFIAGGFWAPNPEDLKRIRNGINNDAERLKQILQSSSFKKTFGMLVGEKLKTTPKGFDAANPEIGLLRHKQFLMVCKFTDAEVTDPLFVKKAAQVFAAMRPFLNYMTEILTTDANGISYL